MSTTDTKEGLQFGSYRVVDTVGEGGMGTVFEAQHVLMEGKRAAIKLLNKSCSEDRDTVNRFFNEAKSAALASHPGIVDIYDFGYDSGGRAYIIMELIQGVPLSDLVEQHGALPEGRAVSLGWHIARALTAAHENGIIHRDLKPDNVVVIQDAAITSGERTKVVDFGIAKLTGEHGVNNVKTMTGQIFGTPKYMSPEQCHGAAEVGPQTDVYSLGCILYEMVTGRPPFLGEGAGELLKSHLVDAPELPTTVGAKISPALERVILQCLEKETDARQASMVELTAQLDGLRGAPKSGLEGTAPPVKTPSQPVFSELNLNFATLQEIDPSLVVEDSAMKPISRAASGLSLKPEFEEEEARKAEAQQQAELDPDWTPESAMKQVRSRWPKVLLGLVLLTALGLYANARFRWVDTPWNAQVEKVADKMPLRALPTKVSIGLISKPGKANIFNSEGKWVGRTPWTQRFPGANGSVVFTVKKKGFEDSRVTFSLENDSNQFIQLRRSKKKKRSRRKK